MNATQNNSAIQDNPLKKQVNSRTSEKDPASRGGVFDNCTIDRVANI